MDIVNETPFSVDATQAVDKTGGCYLLVVAKATYRFPEEGNNSAEVATSQLPIFDEDIFEDEPGMSTTYFESDWAFRKRRCDIVLKATAYAPDNRPTTTIPVKFKVGPCEKKILAIGPRIWGVGPLGGLTTSSPKPIKSMAITYGKSYGGSWFSEEGDPTIYLENPVGCGYAKRRHHPHMVGTSAPCIGPFDEAFALHHDAFTPVSFGPIGRNWKSRAKYAGTYDDNWKDNVFPLLPSNFDERFYQCAPPDQQIAYPRGGEEVSLWNMHPSRKIIHFKLPARLQLPIIAVTKERKKEALEAVVDTIAIDADAQILSLVWRSQFPIKRSLREINTLAVGEIYQQLWDQIMYGEDEACADCGL